MPTINKVSINTHKSVNQITVNRQNDAKYYNSQSWKALRDWYYKLHPVCEVCEAHGRVSPTHHIHHKFPFMNGKTEEIRWRLLTDPNNLISVCTKCHSAIHQKIDNEKLLFGCYELTDKEYNKAHGLCNT